MEFSSARVDYLVRRVRSLCEMTEIFEGRLDRLHYRHVVFERHNQLIDLGVNAEVKNTETCMNSLWSTKFNKCMYELEQEPNNMPVCTTVLSDFLSLALSPLVPHKGINCRNTSQI